MMIKTSRIIGYIITCMIIAVGLIFKFEIGGTSKLSYYLDIAIISLGGAILINILAIKVIGKVYDDMKLVKTSQSIVRNKEYTLLIFVGSILSVIYILKIVLDKSCELNSMAGFINSILLINIARESGTLYIGNKYAIIQWNLVKLEDISLVTRSKVTKKSSANRSEFIVKTKKGKIYTISCDKNKEDSIDELSKTMSMGI